MNHAYSLLTVKSSSKGPDGMTIEGLASTPQTDRIGDIVEPLGAKFAVPMPLLMNHDSKQVVGRVEFAKATATGIPFRAFLPYVKEPGRLKDRVDEAIHSLQYGLVGAVSIGFNALQDGMEYIKGGGVRFTTWEWLELSLVPIPANPGATITGIKSIDAALARAATGTAAVPASPPAARLAPFPQSTKGSKMSHETIRRMETERVAKMAAAKSIMDKALEDGRTPDAEEQQGYDAALSEVKGIDATLDRLKEFAKLDEKAANIVPAVARPAAPVSTVTHQRSNIDGIPGLAVARMAQAIYVARKGWERGIMQSADAVAERMFRDQPQVASALKAVVVAGSTTSGTWGADLVGSESAAFADFVEYLRPRTIIGRFGIGGVPSLRRVPFRTALVTQTGAGAGYWVGEGKAKPLTAFDFDRTTLAPLKVANICVLTDEVLRDSAPSAGTIIRDQLVAALQARLDTDFIDPAKAVDAGVSPASITNGVTLPNASGTDADAVRADLKTIFSTFIAANNAPTSGVWIMSSTTALTLSLMVNGLGQPEFAGINMNGGTLAGLPVITSEYVPSPTAGDYIFLVNASDIYLADEGGFNVDMSTEASLQMDDAPTQSSIATVTATSVVSMFQTNSVAFRAERTMNWAKRRTSAVAGIDTVNYV